MKTYWRILRYVRPYWGQAVLYTIATILSVIFTGLTFVMLEPLLQQLFKPEQVVEQSRASLTPDVGLSVNKLVDWVLWQAGQISQNAGPSRALLYVALFIVALNLLSNLFKFLSNYTLGTIRTKVIEDLRLDVFNRFSRMHVGFVENQRKGDIMARITSDIVEVEHSVVNTFQSIIRDPASIIWFFALLLMYSVKLTLLILVVLPIAALLISRITRQLKRDATDTQNTFGHIMSVVDETISGVRIIKGFNAEGYIRRIFDRFNSQYSFLSRRQWHRKALVPIFSESAMVLVFGLVLWFGGQMVYSGEIADASKFIAYLILFWGISRPAKSLSSAFSNIYRGLASGERIFELMETPVQVFDKKGAKPVTDFNSSIELRNVTFAYTGEPVLRNINLTFEKGKMYALVGPSGSGKSTLAELLLRFYDPTQGQILFDGVDIKDLKVEDMRRQMAVVTQEPILFNDTVYNNIAFGMAEVTEEDVTRAAKAAHAHEFITALPQGYQTNVGDRGGLLSGGQRQRISIARAVLKNPPILILDEATSALDTSSEKIVQKALDEVMSGRTSVVIAHRLSTIQQADEIIVMEHGHVVERGTHMQLIARDGLYHSLYRLQQLAVEV